jgi:hypothetical protein
VDETAWPPLPLEAWKPTYDTLHLYTQIVGKVKLALTPRVNHFWNVGFTVTPRGLTSGAIPTPGGELSIDFDLLDHNLVVRTSAKETRALALVPRAVAHFYSEVMTLLSTLGIHVTIKDHPVEIPEEVIRFTEDYHHASYDPDPVERWLRIAQNSAQVIEEFRARFIGKASPVLFYWGTFDVSASRFSGRRVEPPGTDVITREAYSHEQFECGFWPGDARFPEPAYFAFMVPAPGGYQAARVIPSAARWVPQMGEFFLPYEAVRTSDDPRTMLLEFFQSSYEAGAELAGWDRVSLELPMVAPTLEAGTPPPTLH